MESLYFFCRFCPCEFSYLTVLIQQNCCFVILDKVCEYFGVKIGMYFAYLGHYTAALLWPASLGLLCWLFSGHQVSVNDVILIVLTFDYWASAK